MAKADAASTRRSLNALVTGGSGFVGSAVVAELIRRGHHVVATSRMLSTRLPVASNLRWAVWDARREPLPSLDWSTLQVVVHLAVPRKPFLFPEHASSMYEVIVASTFRLLEAARINGVRRVLIASTGDTLGPRDRPASEDDVEYMPGTFYASAKACAEILTRSYQSVIPTAILRLYHPYGPGGDQFLVNRLVRSVAEGREVTIEGVDGITLDPVWIDDLAEGVGLAVESDATGIFHFAGPETLTLRALLGRIGTIVNRAPLVRTRPSSVARHHAGEFEQTRRTLGYRPRTSLGVGLRRLITAAQ